MSRSLAGLTLIISLSIPAAFFAQGAGPAGPAAPGRGGVRQGGPGPARDAREAPTGTAVIRGRTLAAATGTPVARVQVRAALAGNRDARLVTTDSEGRFEIRNLAAGRWDLTAAKAGFVTVRLGQRRAFETGRPVEVANGQVIDEADFYLPRGAVITGRITDEFGDPVVNARVQSLRYQLVQGARRLGPVGMTAQTDDTGAYRLFGLMPGEYYVSAVLRVPPMEGSAGAAGYAPTYYPGTASVTEAQAVPLGVGEEATIGFGLTAVRMARVTGTAVGAMGMPVANANVMLAAADAVGGISAAFGGGGRTRGDGGFTLTGVAPGTYTLTVMNGDVRRASGGGEIEMGSVSVTVAGDDLDGVTVVTGRGATVSGMVVAAPGSGKLPASGLQVLAQAITPEPGIFGGRPAPVTPDGAFQLANLFGARVLRLTGLPQQWMLDTVTIGGRDVTDQLVDFGRGQELAEARIVVTDRVTDVSGTVSGRDGRPSVDAVVVVFPDDEMRWRPPTRHVRSVRLDQQGRFSVRALPPGDRYLAVAVDYLEDGEAADPEFLESMKRLATALRVRPGEPAVVSLRLVER